MDGKVGASHTLHSSSKPHHPICGSDWPLGELAMASKALDPDTMLFSLDAPNVICVFGKVGPAAEVER